ncbi:MAG TPA: F0F1 ATP synthase subunit epsilon [Anaerolineaceae bacterium]|nr:F0F1 ATP synthase subunit epsilon [Longilinea sp.]HNR45539.1 F0F1 ATP synthase subunit epsilon [Anaerolineaceae bacterium]HNS36912.1 F0F1 ATP synthase subunit epsilon [Anaerolineaceae bacterium]HNZ13131.1 F0F1 ATP synthase subunit epsilon [Anaerolineaceae bacterium]HQN43745.1 F0F1 ATP synthase subunit epsilon [Anaerolineaceae bacterium]
MPIRCEIVSQDRIVFQGDVDIVVLPGVEGVMGILPDHAPLLSVLQYGYITVRMGREEEVFTVAGGVVEVQPDQVTVLADAAENVEEIDVQRAEAARRRAEEALQKESGGDSDRQLTLQAALRRSMLRLDAARRFGRTRTQRRGS